MVAHVSQPKVLVIDDENLFREMLNVVLQEQYEVISAASAEEGLRLLQNEKPDVILLDIVMPGRDGIQGLRAIRNIDPEVSVIMVTGFPKLETAEQAITLGASDYLEKPIKPDEILKKVRSSIERTEKQKRHSRTFREMQAMLTELSQNRENQIQKAEEAESAIELMYDLKYPLQTALEQLKQVSEKLSKESSPSRGHLALAEETVRRCRELTELCRELRGEKKEDEAAGDLGEMLDEIITGIRPVATMAGIDVDYRSHIQNGKVLTHVSRLKCGLRNLIANAVESSAAGDGDIVRIAASQKDGYVEIRIEDHGNGYDLSAIQSDTKHHFNRRQVQSGAGVGLCLTRHIIRDAGGRIKVQSAPGKGAVVFVTLPIEA